MQQKQEQKPAREQEQEHDPHISGGIAKQITLTMHIRPDCLLGAPPPPLNIKGKRLKGRLADWLLESPLGGAGADVVSAGSPNRRWRCIDG